MQPLTYTYPWRTLRYALLALLTSLAIFACSDDSDPSKTDPTYLGEANTFRVTIKSSTTRVGLAQDGSSYKAIWKEGDEIHVFFKSDDGTLVAGDVATISDISADKRSGTFSGRVPTGVTGNFTLIGVVGMSDVKIGANRKSLLASAQDRPFVLLGEDSNLPMLCQVSTNKTSAQKGVSATFSLVGGLQIVHLENRTGSAQTLINLQLQKERSTDADYFYTSTTTEVPQIDLLTGSVTMVSGSATAGAFSSSTLPTGSTTAFVKWLVPKVGVTEPTLKLVATTSGGSTTSYNSSQTEGITTNPVMKSGSTRRFITRWDSNNALSFREPYIIRTDGGTRATAYVDSLKSVSGVTTFDLGNNTYGFLGVNQSRYFSGLKEVISYGQDISSLWYQYADQFTISAQLTPRITSLAEVFRRGKAEIYPGIENWDTQHVTSMSGMFSVTRSFNQDLSSWDVSSVTNMSNMFSGASSFNQDLSSWDVSSVTDMSSMLFAAYAFNQDLSSWDVSSVTNMGEMFYAASSFNQDLSGWDVSSVTNMSSMFHYNHLFNQDLSSWDVSSVTNMSNMFNAASSFNQDLSSWKMGKVTNMSYMFYLASSFNGDLSSWDVGSVTDMSWMFFRASSFNGDLSSWDVSSVTNMASMFAGASSFDQDLSGWDVSSVTNMTYMFSKASSFNQDLSSWCVTKIKSKPRYFDTNSAFAEQTALQPQWGTCPQQ